jgi:hypothetical protein
MGRNGALVAALAMLVIAWIVVTTTTVQPASQRGCPTEEVGLQVLVENPIDDNGPFPDGSIDPDPAAPEELPP